MTITIDKLTKRQVTIADHLWNCQTDEDVERYIASLPKRERNHARSLKIMMIQAATEAELDDAEAEATAAIERAQR